MSVHDYHDMLFHSARIAAFETAIRRSVEPGMRVLDLGTGLGTYAFFAARAGAAHVTAVEADPVIHVARAVAVGNGLARRIDFVHARAPEGLPEGRFDLIIFEDYPTTFMDAGTWRLLRAVEERHLAEGGALLPGGVRFGLAPVKGPRPGTPDAGEGTRRRFGIDWGELRPYLANTGRKVHLPPDALAADAWTGPRLGLLPLPGPGEMGADAQWPSTGDPVVALALWFDLDLGEGAWVSNAPGPRGEPWGQWLLPVDPPLEAPAGVAVRGRVWRETLEDGAPGWMGWSCEADGEKRRGHDFAGLPLSPQDLGASPRR